MHLLDGEGNVIPDEHMPQGCLAAKGCLYGAIETMALGFAINGLYQLYQGEIVWALANGLLAYQVHTGAYSMLEKPK